MRYLVLVLFFLSVNFLYCQDNFVHSHIILTQSGPREFSSCLTSFDGFVIVNLPMVYGSYDEHDEGDILGAKNLDTMYLVVKDYQGEILFVSEQLKDFDSPKENYCHGITHPFWLFTHRLNISVALPSISCADVLLSLGDNDESNLFVDLYQKDDNDEFTLYDFSSSHFDNCVNLIGGESFAVPICCEEDTHFDDRNIPTPKFNNGNNPDGGGRNQKKSNSLNEILIHINSTQYKSVFTKETEIYVDIFEMNGQKIISTSKTQLNNLDYLNLNLKRNNVYIVKIYNNSLIDAFKIFMSEN